MKILRYFLLICCVSSFSLAYGQGRGFGKTLKRVVTKDSGKPPITSPVGTRGSIGRGEKPYPSTPTVLPKGTGVPNASFKGVTPTNSLGGERDNEGQFQRLRPEEMRRTVGHKLSGIVRYREYTPFPVSKPDPAPKETPIPAEEKPAPTEDTPATGEETPALTEETQPENSLQDVPLGTSVVGYYHRLGNGEFPEATLPAGDPPRKLVDDVQRAQRRAMLQATKRSRESLLLEGSARGILPQNWETMSRDELEEFLTPILQSQQVATQPSLYDLAKQEAEQTFTPPTWEEVTHRARVLEGDDPDNFLWNSVDLAVETWARQQPDFIEENFVYETYQEPWNPQVKSLRILLVNDMTRFFGKFEQAAAADSRVTLETAQSGQEAIAKLEAHPDAYDIVLTDYHMRNGLGTDISMYTKTHQLNIPVAIVAHANAMPSWWFKYGIIGRMDMIQKPQAVFNYASNLVATGRAFPQH